MKKTMLIILLTVPLIVMSISCDKESQSENQQIRLPSGAIAPNFTIKDLTGKNISLADYKGNVILLEFWAAWCPPCRQAIPHLQKLHEELEPKGLKIISVCTQSSREQIDGLLAKHPNYKVTILHNQADQQHAVGYAKYLIDGYPSFFVIGKDGKIVESFKGFDEQNNLEKLKETFVKLGVK